jgi:predicted transcriptional regulator
MKISTIKDLLEADVICCEEGLGRHVYSACGSDMMSDVLAYVKDQAVLMTGLVNSQVIRTADMMDMVCVVYVRGKRPDALSLELAVDSNICVMTTKTPMFACCGILYENGLRGA